MTGGKASIRKGMERSRLRKPSLSQNEDARPGDPVFLAPTVLIFFIAGLLYLLRFERVDNLGAYRIPSETGLLIPSVFDSYPWRTLVPAGASRFQVERESRYRT